MAANEGKILGGIKSCSKSANVYVIRYKTGEYAKLSILNNHVFRYYMSPTGQFLDYPTPINATDLAKINIKAVAEYDNEAFQQSVLTQSEHHYIVETNKVQILFDKIRGTLSVQNKRNGKKVLNECESIYYSDSLSKQSLHQSQDEYFFGGGMQNGRFTHKGEIIHIVNTNNWVDGGVTSPNPFYWSTKGYGVLRNTWQTGKYDFGSTDKHKIETEHTENYFDAFYFINPRPRDILNDYYELTGRPIFMPEFAFYEAHLNTFNRDYWVEALPEERLAILFEDGKYYKSYQPKDMNDRIGILESLNGEKNNYQFSARAMIDRYKRNDMPLGWFVPNDGYGSGYGQTESLEGDLENLKKFVEYANENGVEVALWTESCLEPKDPENPRKGERDLSQEVKVGAVALKCDVAWIGEGYSFGLNAVENATKIFMNRAHNKVRPLIIMVDGWAGTQRYAGIWSGDQTGGKWEYIRFHIPTYIGAGLSGIPIVGSDMDGIYGGGDREVNIRDFQWKTFTPLQLNMDGWGNTEKTPFSYNAEAKAINRAYLKLKSMLLSYNYTFGRESIQGLPMVRAMFLEFPRETPAYTKDSQYQFMWGPYILVAPVYAKSTHQDRPVRNGVYLPDPAQVWVDLFTGDKYQGGKIYNNIETPIWKIPVFIKEGAIIPLVNPNNNPSEVNRGCRIFLLYPNGATSFKVYEDDGKSTEYLKKKYAKTTVRVSFSQTLQEESGNVSIYIHKTAGIYKDMVKGRRTVLQIMTSDDVGNINAVINEKNINIPRAGTRQEFENKENVYYFDEDFVVNPYMREFHTEKLNQKFLLIKIEEINVTESEIRINIKGYSNKSKVFGSNTTVIKSIKAPKYFTSFDEDTTPTSITLRWEVNDAPYYEIERDGNTIFSNISGNKFTFNDFKYESKHAFRIRSASDAGVSTWSYTILVDTKEDPHKNTVRDVTVSSSIPCQTQQEVCNLSFTDFNWWHTDWNMPSQTSLEDGKKITLSFDLNDVYEISKIVYVPREDAGNGTFLKVQYRHSIDGKVWNDMSPIISWDHNELIKVIDMNCARFKHFQLDVLDSVGGFGSGRSMLFYKTN